MGLDKFQKTPCGFCFVECAPQAPVQQSAPAHSPCPPRFHSADLPRPACPPALAGSSRAARTAGRYYEMEDAEAAIRYLNGMRLDDRHIRSARARARFQAATHRCPAAPPLGASPAQHTGRRPGAPRAEGRPAERGRAGARARGRRLDRDPGFKEGRQYGRGKSGGQASSPPPQRTLRCPSALGDLAPIGGGWSRRR